MTGTHPTPTALPELKIFCFTTNLGGGGAEMHLVRLARQLVGRGFAVEIGVMRRGGEYEHRLPAGIPVTAVGGRSRVGALVTIARVVRSSSVDLVYTCLDEPSILALLGTRLLRHPPPVVVSVQIPPSWNYRSYSPLRRRAMMSLMRRLYPSAAAVVGISRGVATDVQSMIPALRAIEVIHNAGFDDEVDRGAMERLPSLPGAEPLVMSCGRLAAQKSYVTLLEAFAIVRRQVPARLRILGDGEDRPLLEARARELGIADVVELPGFVPNPWAHMAEADVFVLSSVFEGFGNVLVEAMACGTPVVTTDAPYGPSEIVRDGVDGLLVPVGDVDRLSEAILAVLQQPDLRHRLSAAGRVRAEEFSAAKSAEQHARLFHRLTGAGVPAP